MIHTRLPPFNPNPKIIKTFVSILLCLSFVTGLQARLRFIGPNPYYSFMTFPQDSQLFKSKASLAFLY